MSYKIVWLTPRQGSSRKYKFYDSGEVYYDGHKAGKAPSLADAIELMKAHFGESNPEVEIRDP